MIETLVTSACAAVFGVAILIWLFRQAESRRTRREATVGLAGESILRQFEADARARIDAFVHYAEELLVSVPVPDDVPQLEKVAVQVPGARQAIDLPRWAKVAFAARVGRFLLSRFTEEDREYPRICSASRLRPSVPRRRAKP